MADDGDGAVDNLAAPEQDDQNVPPAEAAALPVPGREVTTTYRNNPAVIIDGYSYVKKSTVKGVTYWRCAKCHKGCKARGKSNGDSTDVQVTNDNHNHDPDVAKKLVLEARKQAAERKQTGAAAIVDELMYALPDAVAVAVVRRNLLRVANRAKRLDGSRQLNQPLADIVFPEAFTKTATGENFLLYDSRHHEEGAPVIFIFASPIGLQQLRLRDHWSADGTFWCTPGPFKQVYTIHANIGSSSIPAAYMLLQNRDETTYKRALRALVRHGNLQDIMPTTFMHDFELAAIKAIKAVFPDSLIRLCLFHFAQSLWRKLQELGLVPLYKSVSKAKILLRCFGALATVPVEDVLTALDEIVEALRQLLYVTNEIPMVYNQAIMDFEDYFEKTYVNRLNADNVLVAPLFRPALWNCFMAILQELHRTNNAVEGWHNEFNNTCTSAHPPLDKFIVQLQNDEDKNRQRLVRHEALPANPLRNHRKAAYMASDKHILAIARKYRTEYRPNGQILRYLKCMQYHLCQADFGEDAAAVDGQEAPADATDDGHDDGDDEGIPLNESHPDPGESEDSDSADGSHDEDEGDQPAVNVVQYPAQPPLRVEFQLPARLRIRQAAQSQDDGMLPGGSQLDSVAGPSSSNATARRQPKRTAAMAASQSWGSGLPSASRARFS